MKPRYILKEGKPVMANDVIPGGKFALPAHLQGKPKNVNWGDIDPKQRLLPRIKLLQATSPECADYPGVAIAGQFWHTTLTESLGAEVVGVPIMRRQSYSLWAPKGPGEERGVLARARDYIHWDPPDAEFQVRFPMNPKVYTWKTAKTVAESGLAEWGSSRDDDPQSQPAATLTFEVLWFLPDFSTLALSLNTRSGIKEAKKLFAMVDAKPTNPFFQRYKICAVRNQGPTGEVYYGYRYRGDGYTDGELSAVTEPMFAAWKDVAFATADEADDGGEAHHAAPKRYASSSDRGATPMAPQGMGAAVDDDIVF